MFTTSMTIKDFDADLFAAMEGERQRQEDERLVDEARLVEQILLEKEEAERNKLKLK